MYGQSAHEIVHKEVTVKAVKNGWIVNISYPRLGMVDDFPDKMMDFIGDMAEKFEGDPLLKELQKKGEEQEQKKPPVNLPPQPQTLLFLDYEELRKFLNHVLSTEPEILSE